MSKPEKPAANQEAQSGALQSDVNRQARAAFIIQDLLMNHLPRIEEGLRKGYVDENQILLMYDHAVRARILQEHAG